MRDPVDHWHNLGRVMWNAHATALHRRELERRAYRRYKRTGSAQSFKTAMEHSKACRGETQAMLVILREREFWWAQYKKESSNV